MTGLDAAAARARCNAATPGPWFKDRDDRGVEIVMSPEPARNLGSEPVDAWPDVDIVVASTEHADIDYATADAEFIAHARTDLVAALDALDRVLALCDANVGRCELCGDRHNPTGGVVSIVKVRAAVAGPQDGSVSS